MRFVRIIDGLDHLWAVKAQGKEVDELTLLFRNFVASNKSTTFAENSASGDFSRSI